MIPVPKDAIDEIGRLAAEVSRLRERVAALEEALRPFARVCDIIPVDDGEKEERCHVWGDVSRWKLPEFTRRGTPETPARGDGVKEGDD